MIALAVALGLAGAGLLFGLIFDVHHSRRSTPTVRAVPLDRTDLVMAAAAGPKSAPKPAATVAPAPAPAALQVAAAAPPVTVVPSAAAVPPVTVVPSAAAAPPVSPVPRAVAPGAPVAADSSPLWAETSAPAAPTGSPVLLSCRGVHVAYGDVRVLFGVDLDVRQGEIVALLGTNGAGKSTLLRAVSGLVIPVEGSIVFDGRDITRADAVDRAALGIVQVPGGKAVFPTLSVAEHFKAASWLFAKESQQEVRSRTERVLTMFPRLRERWDHMAGNLSGGEQQQLGLGMAFVAKPRLLIIDELSLGLAPTVVEQLLDIVRAIHAQGCTIILVEQSVNVALTIAHRAYFMEKGEIRFEGPAGDLLERRDLLRSVFLEGASVRGNGEGMTASRARAPGAVAARVEHRPIAGQAELKDGPVALRVRGLTKTFGGISAVEDVGFELRQGQALGLIGPNGAGKTTIFDLISGVLPADGGSVELAGRDITSWTPDRRARAGLGRSFQDARIFPSLTVTENIALGLERHIEVRDHLASLLNLPAVQESEVRVHRRVEELIDLMGLEAYRDKFVSELSTGVRRVVDLAMALAHEPSVLLLDEPSSGIAQRETEALGVLLTDIQRETRCSMLLIEHDMPLVSGVCDELIALDLGCVIAQGPPAEVLSDPLVVTSYLGGDIRIVNRSGTAS